MFRTCQQRKEVAGKPPSLLPVLCGWIGILVQPVFIWWAEAWRKCGLITAWRSPLMRTGGGLALFEAPSSGQPGSVQYILWASEKAGFRLSPTLARCWWHGTAGQPATCLISATQIVISYDHMQPPAVLCVYCTVLLIMGSQTANCSQPPRIWTMATSITSMAQ